LKNRYTRKIAAKGTRTRQKLNGYRLSPHGSEAAASSPRNRASRPARAIRAKRPGHSGTAALPEVPATELLWQTVGTLLVLGGGVALTRWIPRQRLPAVEDVR